MRARQETGEYRHARDGRSSREGKCIRKEENKLSETNIETRGGTEKGDVMSECRWMNML